MYLLVSLTNNKRKKAGIRDPGQNKCNIIIVDR